jgi:hypothetical protein
MFYGGEKTGFNIRNLFRRRSSNPNKKQTNNPYLVSNNVNNKPNPYNTMMSQSEIPQSESETNNNLLSTDPPALKSTRPSFRNISNILPFIKKRFNSQPSGNDVIIDEQGYKNLVIFYKIWKGSDSSDSYQIYDAVTIFNSILNLAQTILDNLNADIPELNNLLKESAKLYWSCPFTKIGKNVPEKFFNYCIGSTLYDLLFVQNKNNLINITNQQENSKTLFFSNRKLMDDKSIKSIYTRLKKLDEFLMDELKLNDNNKQEFLKYRNNEYSLEEQRQRDIRNKLQTDLKTCLLYCREGNEDKNKQQKCMKDICGKLDKKSLLPHHIELDRYPINDDDNTIQTPSTDTIIQDVPLGDVPLGDVPLGDVPLGDKGKEEEDIIAIAPKKTPLPLQYNCNDRLLDIPNRSEDFDLMHKPISVLWDEKCKTGLWDGSFFCELGYKNPIAWLIGSLTFSIPDSKNISQGHFLNIIKKLAAANPLLNEITNKNVRFNDLVNKLEKGNQINWSDMNNLLSVLSNPSLNTMFTNILETYGISVKDNDIHNNVSDKRRESFDLNTKYNELCLKHNDKWNGTLFCKLFDNDIKTNNDQNKTKDYPLNTSIRAFLLKFKFNVNINQFIIDQLVKVKQLIEGQKSFIAGIVKPIIGSKKIIQSLDAFIQKLKLKKLTYSPMTFYEIQQLYEEVAHFSYIWNKGSPLNTRGVNWYINKKYLHDMGFKATTMLPESEREREREDPKSPENVYRAMTDY